MWKIFYAGQSAAKVHKEQVSNPLNYTLSTNTIRLINIAIFDIVIKGHVIKFMQANNLLSLHNPMASYILL